jgi:hypothetical protein
VLPRDPPSLSCLRGGPIPTLISVPEKVDRPDHKPAIFLKSPSVVFGIREALDFRQQNSERLILTAIEAVKIDQVT